MRTSSRLFLSRATVAGGALVTGLAVHGYVTQSPISYWPVGNVTWEFNLVTPAGSPSPSAGSPLQDGSTSWDDAVGVAIDAYNALIPDNVLVLVANKASSVTPGSADGVNNVAFSDTIYGSTWGSSTLGISISRWTGQKRVENDVLFNGTKKWNAYTGAAQGGSNDIRRVALHEFGHSLGLNHPDQFGQVVSAIMNSTTSNLDALQQDDIDGIASLYSAINPITIVQHPQSFTTPTGGDWDLSVTVTGSETISYDWERSTNGGATWTDVGISSSSTSFTYPSVNLSQNGWQVRVNITNPAGTVTSNVATLTVTASGSAPSITTDPQNVNVADGGTANFTVAASGSPSPTFQWQRSTDGGTSFQDLANGAGGVSGATTTSLQISSVSAAMSGHRFRAVATNASGSDTSQSATLTVGTVVAPAITNSPVSASLSEGATASFTVAASGTPAPGLQWQRSTDGGASWSDLANGTIGASGTQTATLDLAQVIAALSGDQFRAVATNVAGSATSAAATLSVTAVVPLAPTGASRTNTSTSGFTATWDAVFNATGYRLDVATDAGFTSYVPGYQDLDVGNVSAADLTGLTPGSYYLRVRAYNSQGTGTSSETVLVGVGGRVLNLSTRGRTAEGAETLIIGFVIQGSANKELLIRAGGPSLSQLGLSSGTVANPRLALFDNTGTPIPPGNDDWDHTDQSLRDAIASVFAFPYLEPSVDAAMVVSLPPGLYTAHVQTVTGAAGVTLVELYELDGTSDLINISTRAFVGEDAAVLIPGTFLGTAPKRVLVRAVGETLGEEPFNVPGVLADPIIEVVPAGELTPIHTNDDWGSEGNVAEIEAARKTVFGFPLPSGSRDAVILADLPAGGFTFVVRGKNGATGIVLFELYVVP